MLTKRKGRSQLVLVLGGASSGKSDIALDLALKGIGGKGSRAFLATAEGLDEEMAAKIARHRLSRSSDWVTVEVPVDLAGWMERHGGQYRAMVVDCLTMWLSNCCEKGKKDQEIVQETLAFLRAVRHTAARVVLVGNELGMGLVPADTGSRRFRELAGTVNRLAADEADEAYLAVAGLTIPLK